MDARHRFYSSSQLFENFAPKTPKSLVKGKQHMKTVTNIIYPAFALFALACFAVLPAAQADNNPKPTPTPTPTATPTPTPNPGENRGNGNSAAENVNALN